MSVLRDLIDLSRELREWVRPHPQPTWRHGHGYLPDNNQCVYCKLFVPSRGQVTNPPCPGPDHKLTKAELGR